MITQSHLKCPSCRLYFGFQNTPKILKACSHTICLNCLKNIKCCPIDLVEINLNKWGLKSFLTNISILEEIQKEGNGNVNSGSGERFSFAAKKEAKSAKSENNSLFGKKLDQSTGVVCKAHFKKCDFICKKDLSLKCSSCLQVQSHSSSNIISYQELLKNLTHLTDKIYGVYQQLNQCSQKITKRKIDTFIESEIMKNKEKQAFEIRNHFQQLIEKIRKHERQLLQKLQMLAVDKIKKLKETIHVGNYREKNQNWNTKVHRLTTVVESVYNWKGFEEALQYLLEDKEQLDMVSEGSELIDQMIKVQKKIRNTVQKETKGLKCSFDPKIIQAVEQIYTFNSETSNFYQNLPENATQTDSSKPFRITKTISQIISFPSEKQQSYYQPQIETSPYCAYPPSPSLSQQQDFLLDTQKSSFHHNQTLTKNDITFEQNFSLVENDFIGKREQFTPILRKEQDSIQGLEDQSTIINMKNTHRPKDNSEMLQRGSEDITLEFRQIKKNISSSCQKIRTSDSKQLSQTLIYTKQRSPLKSILNSNFQSKQKKLDIPQKYLPVWESAKNDKSQTIDLTGAQLGDQTILMLCNYLMNSQKIRSLKLIRNKLTDCVIEELINCVSKTNISSLNLSQNSLTQKTLDLLEQTDLGNLKSITLSLNKIVFRKVRDRIEKFKERGITLTV